MGTAQAATNALELPPNPTICPPERASDYQSLRVIVNYLQSHPQDLHKRFRFLAVMALRDAWPCPAQSR